MTTDDGKLKIDFSKVKNVLVAIAAALGLLLGIVNAINSAIPPNLETLGVSNFDSITLSGDLNAANVTASSGLTATTLTVNGVAQSGAVKFGVSANVLDGASISHGFATTPTVVLVSGSNGITATVGTITATRFTVNVPVTATIYWIAGP